MSTDVGNGAPLTHEGGEDGVGVAQLFGPTTGILNVLVLRLGRVGRDEATIQMAVYPKKTRGTGVRGDVFPGGRALERVVHDDHQVRIRHLGLDGVVSLHRKATSDLNVVVTPRDGLVDQLQSDDGVSIVHGAVLPRDGLQHRDGPSQVRIGLPSDVTIMAGVIKAIL